MKTHTTNTNSTTNTSDTTSSTPTLAVLITAYRADLAERQREQEEDSNARVQSNIKQLQMQLASHLSWELREALQFDVRRSVQYYGLEIAEAYFSIGGVMWSVRQDEEWVITGPKGYQRRAYTFDDAAILGAIDNYPAWLEREQQKDGKEAERRYTSTEGTHPRIHLLHPGAYVTIWYVNYYYTEIGPVVWGTVEAFDKHWLLLTSDTGHQQIINRRNIATIEPRKKPQPKPEPEPETAAEQPAQYNPDMMSEEIPF